MPGLLVDRQDLVNHKLNALLNIPKNYPHTRENIGIVFLIPLHQYNLLLQTGDKKKYMNSDKFIKSIYGSYFVVYRKNKKICELRDDIDKKHLSDVVTAIHAYSPNDIVIWSGVISLEDKKHDEKVSKYIENGFDNPHITMQSPLNHEYKTKGVAFYNNKRGNKFVMNKLQHMYKQYAKKGNGCSIYIRFSKKTVLYMKKINRKNQKELAGSLIAKKVIKNKGLLVFELYPNPESVINGEEEDVDAVWSRYNFHTHPKKAYDNNGVVNGWPSSQDYVGFLGLNGHTVFHTVITLEGVYIISLSSEWGGKMSDIDKSYVYKHYNIDHKEKLSFEGYVKLINEKTYKGRRIFDVKFLKWSNATKVFSINYEKTSGMCLATEDMYKMYNSD